MKYDFLIDTYETECVKVSSVWSEFKDEDLPVRPRHGDPRGRSVHEHMVHQCVSEDLWFRDMLGIDVGYGPTADTGGLMQNDAPTIYAYPNVEALFRGELEGGAKAALPVASAKSVTERPASA